MNLVYIPVYNIYIRLIYGIYIYTKVYHIVDFDVVIRRCCCKQQTCFFFIFLLHYFLRQNSNLKKSNKFNFFFHIKFLPSLLTDSPTIGPVTKKKKKKKKKKNQKKGFWFSITHKYFMQGNNIQILDLCKFCNMLPYYYEQKRFENLQKKQLLPQ